jgi:RNA polymerase sigma-70 factor (ECF subfamily)
LPHVGQSRHSEGPAALLAVTLVDFHPRPSFESLAYTVQEAFLTGKDLPAGAVGVDDPLLRRWVDDLAGRWRLARQDAEDLLQDVYLLLLRELPKFTYDPHRRARPAVPGSDADMGPFRCWLKTVLRNKGYDLLRRQQRLPATEKELSFLELASEDSACLLEEAQEHRRYLVERIVQLVQGDFQPATWQAFWQQAIEGKPAAEVARRLGMSVDAVYTARCRVLRRLRERRQEIADFED